MYFLVIRRKEKGMTTIFNTKDIETIQKMDRIKLMELLKILEKLSIRLNQKFYKTIEGRKLIFNVSDSIEYVKNILSTNGISKATDDIDLHSLCGIQRIETLLTIMK